MRHFRMKTYLFLLIISNCLISYVSSKEKIFTPNFEKTISNSTQASAVLALLNNSKSLLEEAMRFAALPTSCPTQEAVRDEKPMDCSEILEANSKAESGIYQIWPRSRTIEGSIDVYCDMDDEGGAWTVIQRRGDFGSGEDYFYKPWDDYKHGFGCLKKDFWLGNDNIFVLTNQRSSTVKFVLTDWDGNTRYATYDNFWIDDEDRKYKLHVSGYKGTAGDSFSDLSGVPFSTKDRDNDNLEGDCANLHKGAWWHNTCMYSTLNGLYLNGGIVKLDGVIWYHWKKNYYSMKDTVIKIRPKCLKTKKSYVCST